MSVTTINTDIKWDDMQWEYENTVCKLGYLAEKYNTYKMNISRRSKAYEWVKFDPVKVTLEKKEKMVVNPNGILDTVAIRKIREIVEELGDNYSPVDEPLVVMYAKSYQRYLKLEAVVDAEGETLVSPKTGGEYMNPSFSALQAVISNMSKLGDKLGLSISSRKRLNISLGKEEKTKSLFDLVADMSQDGDIDV